MFALVQPAAVHNRAKIAAEAGRQLSIGDALNQHEREIILSAVDPNAQYSIHICTDATAFEKAITLRQVHVLTGSFEKHTTTTGRTLLGRFSFGLSELKTDAMKRSSGKMRKGMLLDTERPAAALVETRNIGYDDLSVLMDVRKIVLYLPSAAAEQAG